MVRAVDGVSFDLDKGEILAIVGESGSGKSVTAQTVAGPHPGAECHDHRSRSSSTATTSPSWTTTSCATIRGERIAMIFQDPMTSLNPVYRVGDQIVEMIRAHRKVSKREARDRAVELLRSVGIPNPERRVRDYPHEFSGGMRQRVMIAMALALDPDVLIADEPTTALDVTVQAQILRLLDRLNRERGLAVVLITHDLGVVAEIADRVAVMYAGQIVEDATLEELFYDPQHPYTWGLLGSIARLDRPDPARLAQIAGLPPSLLSPPKGCRFAPRCPHEFDECAEPPPLQLHGDHVDRCWLDPEQKTSTARGGRSHRASETGGAMSDPLLEVTDLVKHFPIKSGIVFDRVIAHVKAVDGVSLTIHEGETLGLVGESGCGKSTLSRTILQLTAPTSGSVRFCGEELVGRSRRSLRPVRRQMQMIFQDPYASLNPRKRIGQIIGEPMELHGLASGRDADKRTDDLLDRVGLQPEHANRYPARVLRRSTTAHRHRQSARSAT